MYLLRRRLVVGFAALAIPLGVASAAFACQSLSTLALSPGAGPVGTSVTATGGNYSSSTSASAVDIHLDTREGPVLASTRPSSTGTISVTFTIPSSMAVGYHNLVATQKNANGTPKSGTPGRSSFQVTTGAVGGTSGAVNTAAAASPGDRFTTREIALPGVRSIQTLYSNASKRGGGNWGLVSIPVGLLALAGVAMLAIRKRRSSATAA